jgi:Rhodopirellula transposase DDE domain
VATVRRPPLSNRTSTVPFICVDRGGSNAARDWAWKYHLQKFSDEAQLEVVVGNYPPGTSKWSKIEHQMCSFISMNWKGEPLVSFETVVKTIGATKIEQGLKINAVLDEGRYQTGVKISRAQMKEVNIQPQRRTRNGITRFCRMSDPRS